MHDATRFDLLLAPDRRCGQGCIDEPREALDIIGRELLPESGHLRSGQAVRDCVACFLRLQAPQVLGQERGSDAPQPVGAMTAGAVLCVHAGDRFIALKCESVRRECERRGGRDRQSRSQASPPLARRESSTGIAGGGGDISAAPDRAARSSSRPAIPISMSSR